MYHTLAYFNGAVPFPNILTQLNAVADQIVTVNSGLEHWLPWDAKLKLSMTMGALVNRAEIHAPSQRRMRYPDIFPLEVAAIVGDLPNANRYPDDHCPFFNAGDGVSVWAANGGGVNDPEWAALFFEPAGQYEAPPPGVTYPFRFTGAAVAASGAWAQTVLTPLDTIPPGNYAVVGMACQGANVMAARLIFQGGGPRPGCIAVNAIASNPWDWFRHGRFGKLGQFNNVSIPYLEVFGVGATAAQVVILDLVPIGPQPMRLSS